MSVTEEVKNLKGDMRIREIIQNRKSRFAIIPVFLLCIAGTLTACVGQPKTPPAAVSQTDQMAASKGSRKLVAIPPAIPDDREVSSAREEISTVLTEIAVPASFPELDAMQRMFGSNCISEHTCEVQISECEQEVYFVPYAPSRENPEFYVQIILNGQVLDKLSTYVPDELAGEEFSSLDAVSFFDLNFDGNTDILLLETYGDTRFAAVYYGDSWISYDGAIRVYFYIQEELSEYLYEQVAPLTCSEIVDFLTGGKENGEFASYQEAYAAVSRVHDLSGERREYNLIYFDEDDIPELVVGVSGYWMSLYTYNEGTVYCLANEWGYGAFGNAGYEYVPRKNSLRNFDADNAGQIMNITYATINPEHSMEEVVWIQQVFSEEMNEDMEYDCTTYVNGEEVAEDEIDDYDVGEYEYIDTILSLQELLDKLGR